MNGWAKHKPLNDENIKESVKLWCDHKKEVIFEFGDIKYWNTSSVTNMRQLFQYERDFNEDISDWDVSNVRDMSYMLESASSFNLSKFTKQ